MAIKLFHWRAKEERGNFGDALTLLYTKWMLSDQSIFRWGTLHLVGSVISVDRITTCIRDGFEKNDGMGRAIFWGCGKKNEQHLPSELQRRAIFLGVRGVMTRDALGLPKASTPLGDTALLLPRFYRPKHHARASGKVLWVPHVHHPDPTERDLAGCPDYLIKSPAIPNSAEACEEFVDAVASARFVMANAMHAAIVALAYGTPFCFWGGSYINHPFKWSDFTSGVGFKMDFVASFKEAERMYDRIRPDQAYATMNLDPLLDVAPYRVVSPFPSAPRN